MWFRGTSYQQALRWWDASPWEKIVRKGLLIFGQYLCSDFIKSVASQGGEPFLPTILGGLGFPHPTGRELSHVRPWVLRCIIHSLRDDQRPEVFWSRLNFNVWQTAVNDSPLAHAAAKAERIIFDFLFSPVFKAQLNLLPLDESAPFCWMDLNLLRNIGKLDLPLSGINFRLLSGIMKDLSPKWEPIGSFWKKVQEICRALLVLDYSSEGVESPSFRMGWRLKRFRQLMKSYWASNPETAHPAYSPKKWSNWSISELETRVRWAEAFIWVKFDGNLEDFLRPFILTVGSEWSIDDALTEVAL